LTANGKKLRLEYRQSSGDKASAGLGSADLLMKWDHLRNRELEIVENGDIGSVFLKIALDLDLQLPDGFDGKKPRASYHFQTAAGKWPCAAPPPRSPLADLRPALASRMRRETMSSSAAASLSGVKRARTTPALLDMRKELTGWGQGFRPVTPRRVRRK